MSGFHGCGSGASARAAQGVGDGRTFAVLAQNWDLLDEDSTDSHPTVTSQQVQHPQQRAAGGLLGQLAWNSWGSPCAPPPQQAVMHRLAPNSTASPTLDVAFSALRVDSSVAARRCQPPPPDLLHRSSLRLQGPAVVQSAPQQRVSRDVVVAGLNLVEQAQLDVGLNGLLWGLSSDVVVDQLESNEIIDSLSLLDDQMFPDLRVMTSRSHSHMQPQPQPCHEGLPVFEPDVGAGPCRRLSEAILAISMETDEPSVDDMLSDWAHATVAAGTLAPAACATAHSSDAQGHADGLRGSVQRAAPRACVLDGAPSHSVDGGAEPLSELNTTSSCSTASTEQAGAGGSAQAARQRAGRGSRTMPKAAKASSAAEAASNQALSRTLARAPPVAAAGSPSLLSDHVCTTRGGSVRKRRTHKLKLLDMLRLKLLSPGPQRLLIGNSTTVDALILDNGCLQYEGNVYESVSSLALQVLRMKNPGRRACDGWQEVRMNGKRLDDLRREATHALSNQL